MEGKKEGRERRREGEEEGEEKGGRGGGRERRREGEEGGRGGGREGKEEGGRGGGRERRREGEEEGGKNKCLLLLLLVRYVKHTICSEAKVPHSVCMPVESGHHNLRTWSPKIIPAVGREIQYTSHLSIMGTFLPHECSILILFSKL